MTENVDRKYMKRAIELAKKGEGWAHPNPLVGAVIVKDGRIIGEGFHAKYGGLHAERNAIASLKESGAGAVMYVTLEPCCHYGKTPPCVDAIIAEKIGHVIIGSADPNPKVAGRGAEKLRRAGVKVTEDLMKDECDELNGIFFHYITTKRPYVIMKYAMTADGKIAAKTGESRWITGEPAREEVQHLRHRCMGIMVGIGTVLADDPMLNCRLPGGRSPIRIICDSRLRIPEDSSICRTADRYETMVAFAEGEADPQKQRRLEALGIETIPLPRTGSGPKTGGPGGPDLDRLMSLLGEREIDSLLLEGGGTLNESALRAGIVSEVRAFVAPKIFGGQARSPVEGIGVEHPDEAMLMELMECRRIGADLMLRYRPAGDVAGGRNE